MKIKLIKYILLIFFIVNSFTYLKADVDFKIKIIGNERISNESIKMFSKINSYSNFDDRIINEILKNLYDTNYFKDISIKFEKNILTINVTENPIILNITFDGIKSNSLKQEIIKNLTLKSRSSYNSFIIDDDKKKIQANLKKEGYFFSKIDVSIIDLGENKVDVFYKIDLGDKAKINKISFIGNKIFKDNKLKNIIVSEEYKFWKIISGKKYLNENSIDLDKRLLKRFYLNQGYYNVEINSSFARKNDRDEFELIYNINANNKVLFGDFKLILPNDYDRENFKSLDQLFLNFKNKLYSINKIEKILLEIDKITLNEQYDSIKASVEEVLDNDKLNLFFLIEETEKFYVRKINILGNNITRENVIRNQMEIDEGDPFNELLFNKSINNIKNLNFFKSVTSKISTLENKDKVIDLIIEEKATGEIQAGAGFGTNGATFIFGIKENNYLGKGISLNSNLEINENSTRGIISVSNPNLNNTDNSGYATIEASETDKLSSYGYKANKTGFSYGTGFEYKDDLILSLGNSNYLEKIETNSSASTLRKQQKGNYFDSFINMSLDFDKRNQKFQSSDGFRSNFLVSIPIVSKSNTLMNKYDLDLFTELFENNITTFSIGLQNSSSLNGGNIKLSERLYIPSKKLRGFETGKVGPKDGNDYIGGNYLTTINLTTTIPQILPSLESTDFVIFFDAANLWGVDYNSSLNDSKIRSSIGVGVDWWTPVGPLSFSFSEALTKSSNDVTESFRFNIGTTF